jgi:hypothetical protein
MKLKIYFSVILDNQFMVDHPIQPAMLQDDFFGAF